MAEDSDEIESDPLFIGLTRPALLFGIPYEAFVVLAMVTGIVFLAAGKPLYLLSGIPVYGILYLASANDPNVFRSGFLWAATMARSRNNRFWGSVSFSPLKVKKWND